MISERTLANAKQSILTSCRGSRARYPITESLIEAIIDDFIDEVVKKSSRSKKKEGEIHAGAGGEARTA